MAKLKAVLKSLDGLTEDQKELYEEGEDKQFYLQLEDLDSHASVKGLRNALTRLKGETGDMKKLLAALPEGTTPDEIRALVQERQKAEEDKAKAAGKWDELKTQLNTQHAAQMTALNKRLAARDSYITRQAVENAALKALNDAKGNPKLLLPHVINSLLPSVVEEGDDVSLVMKVVGPDRKPRLSPKGDGSEMTLAELIGELRGSEDFAVAFEGTTASGTGAPQSTGPGTGAVRSLSDLKTPAEKAAYIGKYGLEAFNQLLAADLPANPFERTKTA